MSQQPPPTTTSPRPALALFIPNLAGGGAERVMVDIAKGFADTGQPVDLVVVSADGELAGSIPDGVRLVALGQRRVALSVGPLARYLRRERPAALVTALSHANMAAIAANRLTGRRTRLVVTEHIHMTTFAAHATARRDRITPWLIGRVYRHADLVVTVSAQMADDLAHRTGFPRDRIRVIYNPIPAARIDALAAEPARHPFAAEGAPPYIVGVGRMTDQKDFATLVRAFAAVRAQRECRLLILGDGPLRPELEALVAELGVTERVSLPGFVKNPYPLIRHASMLAMSSRWEGLPTVLLEALYLGVPLVSTDCPSGPREILHDGALGRLVPVADPDALAAAIARTLDEPMLGNRAEALAAYRLSHVIAQYAAAAGLTPSSNRG